MNQQGSQQGSSSTAMPAHQQPYYFVREQGSCLIASVTNDCSTYPSLELLPRKPSRVIQDKAANNTTHLLCIIHRRPTKHQSTALFKGMSNQLAKMFFPAPTNHYYIPSYLRGILSVRHPLAKHPQGFFELCYLMSPARFERHKSFWVCSVFHSINRDHQRYWQSIF